MSASEKGAREVAVIVGTRPEAIKMAPIVQTLRESERSYDVRVVATAQHRELLDSVLSLFQIVPDVDLNIMQDGQTLFQVAERALSGLGRAFSEMRPDIVLVQGDTTTTFAAALAASYLRVPVGHVEAGLRTYDRYSPFPEEINRCMTSSLSTLHFAPTTRAADALLRENVDPSEVFITGNTVIDALEIMCGDTTAPSELPAPVREYSGDELILMTAHRRESFGAPMREVFEAVAHVARTRPGCLFVYPVHPNPSVRGMAEEVLGGLRRVLLIEPLEYGPFVRLMRRAKLILTDSGGIQEEAPSLAIPVLVTREVTERPEAVEAGAVKLVGTNGALLKKELVALLDDSEYYKSMAHGLNPYGDGQAARRIVRILSHRFFGISLPEPFVCPRAIA